MIDSPKNSKQRVKSLTTTYALKIVIVLLYRQSHIHGCTSYVATQDILQYVSSHNQLYHDSFTWCRPTSAKREKKR